MINVKKWNQWRAENLEAEIDLTGADLSDANLTDADLSDANLTGADLSDANLTGADLSDANLTGADLRNTNLRNVDLSDANLLNANLSGANLSGANLSGANLTDADLSGADLSGADLSGADLSNAKLPPAPVVPNLDAKILEAVKHGGFEMSQWHTCETTHCRAGWAIVLAGEEGKALEDKYGSAVAGTLIYQASTGRVPNFYASNSEALADIKVWQILRFV